MFRYFIFLLFIFGCTLNFSNNSDYAKPISIQNIYRQTLNYIPQKAVFTSSELLYTTDKNHIYIYQNKRLINKIGGYGFEKNNFSELSDFTISNTGNLIVLDGLQREIKIFDKSGSWLNTLNLNFTLYPTLLDITDDAILYIYDADKHKIFVTKDFSNNADFSFADLEFEEPTSLVINDNYITINTKANKTYVYDISGQLLYNFDNYVQILNGNVFMLSNDFNIKNEKSHKIIYTSTLPIRHFFIKHDFFTIITNKNVTILKAKYE